MADLLDEMRQLLGEAKVEDLIRAKLKEIEVASKSLYRGTSPENLADELEELLKQANLARPAALTKQQYRAVANVWDMLGSDLDEVGSAVVVALRLL